MASYTFEVPGKPKGKDRPRFFNGHAYTPKETKDYEKLVSSNYRLNRKMEGELTVRILMYFKPPKSTPKYKLSDMLKGYIRPRIKPDIDNVIKIILDGLNGKAWDDDKQVVEIFAAKFYDENERVEVTISEKKEENINLDLFGRGSDDER